MNRYRKKPVVVEASDPVDRVNAADIAAWCGGRVHAEPKVSDPLDVTVWIDVPTLEGVMRAPRGWRIIRGVEGEFYPCAPSVFAATYEAVE